jgi:hypothetical protein
MGALRLSSASVSLLKKNFSSDCVAAQKLKVVFEEYRMTNYSDEMPCRFKKNLINAICPSGQDTIVVDDLNKILCNIGRTDQLLSEQELSALLLEAGAKDRCITTKQILELV